MIDFNKDLGGLIREPFKLIYFAGLYTHQNELWDAYKLKLAPYLNVETLSKHLHVNVCYSDKFIKAFEYLDSESIGDTDYLSKPFVLDLTLGKFKIMEDMFNSKHLIYEFYHPIVDEYRNDFLQKGANWVISKDSRQGSHILIQANTTIDESLLSQLPKPDFKVNMTSIKYKILTLSV